ncbi:hypothetical protein, partial [Pseudomonas sp. 2995-3]|uniref:hypothetical protein n=1 Tax=Pseudomonas sp. 2995-3 TaxID=1712680 RepID=UPI001C46E806
LTFVTFPDDVRLENGDGSGTEKIKMINDHLLWTWSSKFSRGWTEIKDEWEKGRDISSHALSPMGKYFSIGYSKGSV